MTPECATLNAIERAVLLCRDGSIEPADLALPALRPRVPVESPEPDRTAIEVALQRAKGNVSQAAAELGLSRQALYRRIEKLGIDAG